jgi:choline kinase
MPHTRCLPKCLLPVDGDRPLLEVQLRALRDAGIRHVRIMVGFEAEKVDAFLATSPVAGMEIETHFNPFFDSTDNLVTAWLARSEMRGEFLLLNGDTLFEPDVLRGLLAEPPAPITLVVNGKPSYDADDMKVSIGVDGRIQGVSKTIPEERVSGESIGLLRFAGEGVEAFRSGLDRAVRTRHGMRAYYLAVIDELSAKVAVEKFMMTGMWWAELDSPEDLMRLRAELAVRAASSEPEAEVVISQIPMAPRVRSEPERKRPGAGQRPAVMARGSGG